MMSLMMIMISRIMTRIVSPESELHGQTGVTGLTAQ